MELPAPHRMAMEHPRSDNAPREPTRIPLHASASRAGTRIPLHASAPREQMRILLHGNALKGQTRIPLHGNASRVETHQHSSAMVAHLGRISVPAAPIPLRNVHQIRILVRTRREEREIIIRHLQRDNQAEVQRVPAMRVPAHHVRVARRVLQVHAPVMGAMPLGDGPAIVMARQHNAHRNDVSRQ